MPPKPWSPWLTAPLLASALASCVAVPTGEVGAPGTFAHEQAGRPDAEAPAADASGPGAPTPGPGSDPPPTSPSGEGPPPAGGATPVAAGGEVAGSPFDELPPAGSRPTASDAGPTAPSLPVQPTPPVPDPPPAAVAAVGAERPFAPEVHRVALDQEAGSPWGEATMRSEAFLLPTPDGGAWLTWNQGRFEAWEQEARPFRASRYMRLGPDLRPTGASVAGPAEMSFSAAEALPDGGFAAIAQRQKRLNGLWYPHEAWFLRFDAAGREVARYQVAGDAGREAGQFFFQSEDAAIATSGDRIGVYMALWQNTAEPGGEEDLHETDGFIAFGPDNQPVKGLRKAWLASHSVSMRVVPGTAAGTFWGLTVGDNGPFGIQFMSSHSETTSLVWRPNGTELQHTESAGFLGDMTRVGELAYATLAGSDVINPPAYEFNEQRAPLLLAVDGEGRTRHHRWLDVARFNVAHVPSEALGDGRLLIGWSSGRFPVPAGEVPPHEVTPTPRFAIYDPARDAIVLGPREADVPFSDKSAWARLADGSVAWAVVQEPNLMEAAIVRVRPD